MMSSHVVEVPNWQTSMTIGFQQLLQNGDLCDVTLEGNDGMDIRCHSVVLAAASPYFRNTLVWTREDFHIKIGSISSSTWKCIVEFVYCGRIVFESQNAMEIMMITKKLGLVALHTAIQQYFRKFGLTEEFASREPRAIERETIQTGNEIITTQTIVTQQGFQGREKLPVTDMAMAPSAMPPPFSTATGTMQMKIASTESMAPTANDVETNTQSQVTDATGEIEVGGQPDQQSFFEGLGLQAQKGSAESSPNDHEPQVRQSKRIVNSGKKRNFRELDGRRQSNQSNASHASPIETKAKEPIPSNDQMDELIDGEEIDFDNLDGRRVLFTCKFCYRVFPNRSLLCKHKAKWHAKSKTKGKKAHKTFWCKLCNISFRAPSALFKHKKDFHPEIINRRKATEDFGDADMKDVKDGEGDDTSGPITELSEVMPKQFTCKVCDEIYPDRHSLYQHKLDEHYVKEQSGRPKGMKYTPTKKTNTAKPRGAVFKCKKCFKAFTNPGSLRWHKCPVVSNPLPEGVTPILPPSNASKEGVISNGDLPITGDEGITPIKTKAELTDKDTGDLPLDLSTKNPGSGMSYRCDECQKVFSSLVLVRWHKMRCTSGRPPMDEHGVVKDGTNNGPACHVCQKVFKTTGYLQWHLNRRHGIRLNSSTPPKDTGSPEGGKSHLLECHICYKTYANKHFLKEHIQSVHEGSVDHKCHYCHKSFSRRYYLAHHIKKVHEGYKPLRCTVCKKAFITKTRLVRHMKKFHDIQITVEEIVHSDDGKSTVKPKPKSKPKPSKHKAKHKSVSILNGGQGAYRCDQCPRRFTMPPHLARHVKATHSPAVIFSCETCSQQFNKEKLLLAHMDKEHADNDDEYISETDMKSSAMPGLVRHSNMDTMGGAQFEREEAFPSNSTESVNDFICGICRCCFSTETDLREHVKMAHENVQSEEEGGSPSKTVVECPHCGKRLSSRTILAQHIRTVHEGVKNYECNICQKKFSQKHHLARHVFLHGGVRPFECKVCNKRFITNYSLVMHIKMSHKASVN